MSLLYRGGFDDGSFAGWLYQGGGGGGSLVNEGGDWVMQLGATGAGAVDAHRHNRHWIPGRASVTLDLRVVAASGGADQLEVNLIDRDGATHVVAAIALDAPGGESAIGPLVIPASVPTPGTFRLELGVRAGGAGTATVRLDDVTIEALPPCPGDIAPPTGLVDVEDVLAVINAWGPCPALPTPCPADLAPPALVVDTDDLLAVINGWGTCPAP